MEAVVANIEERKQKLFLSNTYSISMQRTIVLFYNLLATFGVVLGVWQLVHFQVEAYAILSFAVMSYLTSCVGITVGFHRYFTHRSFTSKFKWFDYALTALGSMACQGPLTYWVATHRCHHQFSDQVNDPHSPSTEEWKKRGYFRRFFHAHIGWLLDGKIVNTTVFARDIIRTPYLMRANNLYHVWSILGFIVPGIACYAVDQSSHGFLQGVLWGGCVRLFFSLHAAYVVNSLCHMMGSRAYDTGEDSHNLAILALPTFGEAWHNNHHAFPASAKFGHDAHQIDIGYYSIWVLHKVGVVKSIGLPTKREV